jgi:hypothetical protein
MECTAKEVEDLESLIARMIASLEVPISNTAVYCTSCSKSRIVREIGNLLEVSSFSDEILSRAGRSIPYYSTGCYMIDSQLLPSAQSILDELKNGIQLELTLQT